MVVGITVPGAGGAVWGGGGVNTVPGTAGVVPGGSDAGDVVTAGKGGPSTKACALVGGLPGRI
jgi:hypothetical protein